MRLDERLRLVKTETAGSLWRRRKSGLELQRVQVGVLGFQLEEG